MQLSAPAVAPAMRVILDTNLLLSDVLVRGRPRILSIAPGWPAGFSLQPVRSSSRSFVRSPVGHFSKSETGFSSSTPSFHSYGISASRTWEPDERWNGPGIERKLDAAANHLTNQFTDMT